MRPCFSNPSAVHEAVKATAATSVDTYEAAARAAIELQRLVAPAVIYAPFGAVARAWTDLERDAVAVQLSTIRWLLDL
jgi:hypothetical protein